MPRHLWIALAALCCATTVSAQWSGASSSTDYTSSISRTGSVGVGGSDSSGTSMLYVNGVLRGTAGFESRAGGSDTAGSGASIFFGSSSAKLLGIQQSSTNDFDFYTWASTQFVSRMRITAGGNVGIATTTPGHKLHVTGTGVQSSDAPLWVSNSGSSTGTDGLAIGDSGSGAYKAVQSYGGALALNPAGNSVGIRNASPASIADLDLGGSTQTAERLRLSGTEYYQGGNGDSNGIAFVLGVNRASNRQLWIMDSSVSGTPSTSTTALRFYVGGASPIIDAITTDGSTERDLILSPSGANVGIGGAPGAGKRLDVLGTAHISGNLTVDGTLNATTVSNPVEVAASVFANGNNSSGITGAAARMGVAGNPFLQSYDFTALQYLPLTLDGASLIFTLGPAGSTHQQKMLIDGNGNLLLGTTGTATSNIETSQNLTGTIIDAKAANPGYVLQSTNSNQESAIWTSGAGTYVDVAGHATPSNNFIAFRTSNTASSYAPVEAMRIGSTGNVGIGAQPDASYRLTVSGDLNVTGKIQGATVVGAVYQDVAEWVPSNEALEPGTVVVLDSENPNHVVASRRSYDTSVAGVISANPGVILGKGGDAETKVATLGRVRVKVDATKHPIHVGDLLVTSDTLGAAMVSEPVDLGGIKIHRPGTLIGKALEPLASGTGEVLVLLSLQ